MDKSQHKKAYKTAGELMRLSAERTGTVEELLLVETARFILTQSDEIRNLQTQLDLLHVENSRLTHRRKTTLGERFERFSWTKSQLGL
jgi:hypothetical protein